MVRDVPRDPLLTVNTRPLFHFLHTSSPSFILCFLPSCAQSPSKNSLKNSSVVTMVKTRGCRTTGTGSASGKATTSDSSPPSARTLQCNWAPTHFTSRDENKLRNSNLVAATTKNKIPGNESRPNPPKGYAVMFVDFLVRGLSLP